MKLPNLIKAVLEKTAPIDPTDLNDLSNKSHLWYDQSIKDLEQKERQGTPLDLKDKIFKHLDAWYVRIFLALGYFWIVRFIQDLMNPGDTELPPDELQ